MGPVSPAPRVPSVTPTFPLGVLRSKFPEMIPFHPCPECLRGRLRQPLPRALPARPPSLHGPRCPREEGSPTSLPGPPLIFWVPYSRPPHWSLEVLAIREAKRTHSPSPGGCETRRTPAARVLQERTFGASGPHRVMSVVTIRVERCHHASCWASLCRINSWAMGPSGVGSRGADRDSCTDITPCPRHVLLGPGHTDGPHTSRPAAQKPPGPRLPSPCRVRNGPAWTAHLLPEPN